MVHRTLIDRIWYQVAKSMLRVLAAVMFRARFSGEGNVPRRGGVLVVSNHQSHLDPPLVGVGFPRLMVFMARRTLFRFRPFGWLIGSLGAIPIDREGFALSGIRATIEWLKHGEALLVFPEGTRSRDGELGFFKPGLALVARRAKVPILPAAIEGAYQAWPRAARLPRPWPVHVHYGRVISVDEIAACSDQQLADLVESRVRECFDLLRERPEFRRATGACGGPLCGVRPRRS